MKKNSTTPYLYVLYLSLSLAVLSCGALTADEAARLSFDKTASQEDLNIQTTQLTLEAGEDVHIWTEMDIEYEGSIDFEYQLLVIKGTDTLNFYKLDPEDRDVTMGEFKTEFGSSTDWRFSGRMAKFTIEEAGDYTFSSLLLASPNTSLELSKADLVIKK